MAKDVFLYDTTLRDGEQAESISFSAPDKIAIARRLDEFGFDYIEGGWPGSNPKAVDFFRDMRAVKLRHAKLAAFGSTRRKKSRAEDDPNLLALIDAHTPAVAIFGKTWDLHVLKALQTTLDENLAMIADSVRFLNKRGREVVYDAEHFFDGFRANPDYAIQTLQAAAEAGAAILVLCDTNGGRMPHEIEAAMARVLRDLPGVPIGIHAHNDAGMGVANSCAAVRCGAVQVQGTINGFGERAGNADLIPIIANLELKYGKRCLARQSDLKQLTALAHFIYETANQTPDPRQPYVGRCNFVHKGGIHVSAVERLTATYEHVPPETVGNRRHVSVSEMAGKSNLMYKGREFNIDLSQADEEVKQLLRNVKEMENEGYQFEAADASVEVLLRKALGKHKPAFETRGFRVISGRRGPGLPSVSEAIVKIAVNGQERHTVAEGDGPVNALDLALRKALKDFYPQLADIRLTDFKVRVVNPKAGTAAKVRVLIESSDGESEWGTIGVSENIIEAAWLALVDSIEYKLEKPRKAKARRRRQ